jgi:hypothetical protein
MKNNQEKPTVSSPTCAALLCVALDKYWLVIPVLFVVLFFGKITMNGAEYKKYKTEFKIKCENKGGVMFVPSGVKGWPRPECRNPNAMIDIDT